MLMKRSFAVRIAKLFYAMFALSFLWLTVHIVTGSYYGYGEVRLLLCILGALALLLGGWKLVNRYEAALVRRSGTVTAGFLAVMLALQVLLGAHLRYQPVFDVDAVFSGAIEWAETGTFSSYYEYFSYFYNNFGGLRFLRWVFLLTRAFGGSDYYMAAVVANSLLSVATMFVTGQVGRRLMGVRGQMMAYVLFAISPPFYFIAAAFYTDALSMLFPVLTYWLYLLAKAQSKCSLRLLMCALMGMSLGLGIQLKPTVAIVLVAIVIDALFTWDWKRTLAMVAAVAVLIFAGQAEMKGAMYQHLDRAEAEQKGTPILHWVMMGLSRNGFYNGSDYDFTRSFTDKAEQAAALKAEIRNRIAARGPSGMVKLLTTKGDICFGDGTYGLNDCFRRGISETGLWELVLRDGAYYGAYQHACTGLLLALYLMMIASACRELFTLKSESICHMAPRLAVFGLLLFLLCWEARWRYFSNYVPLIFVSALLGMDSAAKSLNRAGWLLTRT